MRGVVFVALLCVGVARAAPTAIPTDIKAGADVDVPAPRGQEQKLIDDAKDGTLDSFDLTTAALIASGVDDAALTRERERMLAAVAPARAQAKTQKTAKKRGDRLLRALHDTVLRRYVEQQSRVDTVAATGEFNCLSSAVVFAIAADGLTDKPRGMLSLTHAFVRVDVDGAPADVETTAAAGFAVDRKALVTREYLRARGIGDGLSDEERLRDLQSPEEVTLVGLVAALYSNRGVLAVRQGDLRAAATAFDRAQRISTGELRVRVASWRATLLNNAVVGLIKDKRYDDARRLIAIGLDGAQGGAKRALQQNLAATAVAQAEAAKEKGRVGDAIAYCDDALATGVLSAAVKSQVQALRADLVGKQAQGDQGKCLTLARPAERATCLTSVSVHLGERGKVQESLDAARAATATQSSGDVAERALGAHYNALLGALTGEQEARACDAVESLVRELSAVRERLRDKPAIDLARQMAQCHWAKAAQAVEREDFDGAAWSFARAAVHLPKDPALRRNRAEVDLRRAEKLARAGRCDEARPLVRRAAALDEDDKRGRSLLAFCANEVASAHGKAERFADAVSALRRGLLDSPREPSLEENLGRMLHNEAVSALKAKRCDDALALVPELEERKKPIASDVRKVCGR